MGTAIIRKLAMLPKYDDVFVANSKKNWFLKTSFWAEQTWINFDFCCFCSNKAASSPQKARLSLKKK